MKYVGFPLMVNAWPLTFAYPVTPPVGVAIALVVVDAFEDVDDFAVVEEGFTVELVRAELEEVAGFVDVLETGARGFK